METYVWLKLGLHLSIMSNRNVMLLLALAMKWKKVFSVQCEDCAAHLGGCKHAIAFLAWLHRRSEDPSTTSVECYWKKSKLSWIGTSLKFIKAKEISRAPTRKLVPVSLNTGSFLTVVKNHCTMVGDTNNHLMKFFKEPNNVEKLSMHHLQSSSTATNPVDFLEYCKLLMTPDACEEAALATLEQNDCPLWHELRYGRITASRAYDAAHFNVVDGTLTQTILGASKLRDTEAMKRGRFLENQVLREVEKLQLQMRFSNKAKALFCVAHNDFEKINKLTIIEVDYDRQLCENL